MKECSNCKLQKNMKEFGKDPRCKKCNNERAMKHRIQLKHEVFTVYGGVFCRCCGETEISFLSIDHINNDGAEERGLLGMNRNGGSPFYQYLKNHNFPNPEKYQVLCANCQWGKAFNKGKCPHQQKQYAKNINYYAFS